MSRFRINGVAETRTDAIPLVAGPLSVLCDQGEIRYLRLDGREILRRVYVAVRDRNWRTIPGVLSDAAYDLGDDAFRITFRMTHTSREMTFAWNGTIAGSAAGRVVFQMDGIAVTDVVTNRTGFCVLHPLEGCVGEACTIEHVDGSETRGVFPRDISPHQPFKNICAIRHQAGAAEVRVLLEGDVFEMEDQRNWSDGSFKTYCRPLDLPKPYELKAGTRVRQTITVEVSGQRPVADIARSVLSQRLDLRGDVVGGPMPQIGVAAANGLHALDTRSLAALRNLGCQHLRLDLRPSEANWRIPLQLDAPSLKALDLPLEVALHLPERPESALRDVANHWRKVPFPVARWIILPERGVTSSAHADWARAILGKLTPAAVFAGGTDVEFVAINREHPPMPQLDMLSFSLNPQVHASDDLSLVENLQSHGDLITSARNLSGAKPVAVSPITLRRRTNPDAAVSEVLTADVLPPSVDPRQMSLLAAAWTVGALTRLSSADCLTFFETHGWRGLLMGPTPSPRPDLFPEEPGELFPLYHVLRSVLAFEAQQWSAPPVQRPLELAALLLLKPRQRRLLLANLIPSPQSVGITIPSRFAIRMLAPSSIVHAGHDADFWDNVTPEMLASDSLIELGDYAIAQVDWSEG